MSTYSRKAFWMRLLKPPPVRQFPLYRFINFVILKT